MVIEKIGDFLILIGLEFDIAWGIGEPVSVIDFIQISPVIDIAIDIGVVIGDIMLFKIVRVSSCLVYVDRIAFEIIALHDRCCPGADDLTVKTVQEIPWKSAHLRRDAGGADAEFIALFFELIERLQCLPWHLFGLMGE